MSTEASARAATQTQRYSVCNPRHPGVGGMHLHHLDPLTKTSRGGSSPTSPPAWKHCPRVLQGLCRCLLRRGLRPPPPSQSVWDHAIELHPDAKLPRGRMSPLSPAEQKELDEFL